MIDFFLVLLILTVACGAVVIALRFPSSAAAVERSEALRYGGLTVLLGGLLICDPLSNLGTVGLYARGQNKLAAALTAVAFTVGAGPRIAGYFPFGCLEERQMEVDRYRGVIPCTQAGVCSGLDVGISLGSALGAVMPLPGPQPSWQEGRR